MKDVHGDGPVEKYFDYQAIKHEQLEINVYFAHLGRGPYTCPLCPYVDSMSQVQVRMYCNSVYNLQLDMLKETFEDTKGVFR